VEHPLVQILVVVATIHTDLSLVMVKRWRP